MSTHRYTTEKELLEGFNLRVEAAFALLYDSLYTELLFFVRSLVDKEEAEDITAETFIKLWGSLSLHFDSLSQVKQWLKVTARHACIDLIRRQQRIQQKQQEISYLEQKISPEQLFLFEVETALFKRIAEALEQLDPQRKKIVKMAFLEGLSNEEIAGQLQISRQTVKNTKTDALKILRKIVKPEDLLLNGLCWPILRQFADFFSN